MKPWDDETNMAKLEEAVRSVTMPGLHWVGGASKLVAIRYGIKKLQIMMTIEDDIVSVETLIKSIRGSRRNSSERFHGSRSDPKSQMRIWSSGVRSVPTHPKLCLLVIKT